MFVHLMGHTGDYTREEAIAAIDNEGILPDMLTVQSVRAGEVPQRPRVHRRRDRSPARFPHQGRHSAGWAQAAHRYPQRVSLHRYAAPAEELGQVRQSPSVVAEMPSPPAAARREYRLRRHHLPVRGRAAGGKGISRQTPAALHSFFHDIVHQAERVKRRCHLSGPHPVNVAQ